MKLEDLALTRYRFCARNTLLDDETTLTDEFEKLLFESVQEIGGKENTSEKTSQKLINRKAAKIGHFVPIIVSKNDKGSDIVFFNEFHRTLISGIYLDVYTLQNSVGVAGELTDIFQISTKVETLKKQIGNHSETPLPAECFCYFTEFPESNTETEEILSTLLKTENFSAVEFDYAHFAIDFTERKAVAVIISKNFAEPEAKKKATKLYDELLREYFLSYAKVVFETDNIKRLDAKFARQTLLLYLAWIEKNPPISLSEIESANRELTKYRVDLAEKVKAVEVHLHTIEINIGNAEKVLDNPLLRQKKDDLRRILINPLQLQAEQIKVDSTYLTIYEEKARIIGEEIANLSNLQAGTWGRKLAWLFGSLTLIGALQLFPEFYKELLLWARILILATIIFIPILILFGRDIKHKIEKIYEQLRQKIKAKKAKGEFSAMSGQDGTEPMNREREIENK